MSVYLPVLFCSGDDAASEMIERVGGKYSHVATLLPGGTQVLDARSDVIEGVAPGVQIRPASYLAGYTVDLYELPCTQAQLDSVYTRLRSQLGKPYDKAGIINFGTGIITGDFSDRNWREESAWFCDELAVWAWEQAGVCPPLPITPNRITPGGACLIAGALRAAVSRWSPSIPSAPIP